MNIAIFGASGMVGQGALRVCLDDPGVARIVSIVRKQSGAANPKLKQIAHADFLDFSPIEGELCEIDACLYCLGVASSGMNEADYTRVTHGFTVAAAKTLIKRNPAMSFVFISGAGADSSELSRLMWARVKGKAENALLAMPFRSVYVFRPGMIQPLDGIESKTPSYRSFYKYLGGLLGVLRKIWPSGVTTTEELGRAMLATAKHGKEKRIVEAKEIRKVLASPIS